MHFGKSAVMRKYIAPFTVALQCIAVAVVIIPGANHERCYSYYDLQVHTARAPSTPNQLFLIINLPKML